MENQVVDKKMLRIPGLGRIVLIIVLIISNVGCDQISKSVVRERVQQNEHIQIIQDNFILTNVENNGAFLGVGSSLSPTMKNILLLGMPSIMLVVLVGALFMRSNLSRMVVVGMSFVVGGGVGNILDRFLYGSVTDFLHIDLEVFQTGIFNMADVSVTVGMLLILGYSLTQKKPITN